MSGVRYLSQKVLDSARTPERMKFGVSNYKIASCLAKTLNEDVSFVHPFFILMIQNSGYLRDQREKI